MQDHLFFECRFAYEVWSGLERKLGISFEHKNEWRLGCLVERGGQPLLKPVVNF